MECVKNLYIVILCLFLVTSIQAGRRTSIIEHRPKQPGQPEQPEPYKLYVYVSLLCCFIFTTILFWCCYIKAESKARQGQDDTEDIESQDDTASIETEHDTASIETVHDTADIKTQHDTADIETENISYKDDINDTDGSLNKSITSSTPDLWNGFAGDSPVSQEYVIQGAILQNVPFEMNKD